MAAGKSSTARSLLLLGVIGLFAFGITRRFRGTLAGTASPDSPPVTFDDRVHDEPNDRLADLRGARQLVEQRFSYLEHRRAFDGLDLDAEQAAALELLGDDASHPDPRRQTPRTGSAAGSSA